MTINREFLEDFLKEFMSKPPEESGDKLLLSEHMVKQLKQLPRGLFNPETDNIAATFCGIKVVESKYLPTDTGVLTDKNGRIINVIKFTQAEGEKT